MTTSVYLSNEEVVAIKGKTTKSKIKIDRFDTVSLQEGSILNGVIINEEGICEALKQLRKNAVLPAKGTRLVIDSSSIMVKFEAVPVLPEKKLVKFAENAFNNVIETHGELLYDYSVIDPYNTRGKGCTILCSALEKKMVESYMKLFEHVKVKLECIDIALNCVLKLLGYYEELKRKTFILCVMDSNSIYSALFTNGAHSFSNRYRLISERGTPESTSEISRIISPIIQFHKAQKSSYDIDCAYFCGLRDEERFLCDGITALLNIDTRPIPTSRAIQINQKRIRQDLTIENYIFAIGNLIER